jgi:hypothetical protein
MRNKIVIFLLAALALIALPLFAQQFGQGWVRIMALALLYVLLALGLNIVVGYAGLLDLGYVAFYAVGAYMYALLASPHLWENFEWIAQAFPDGLHTPVWVVIPLAAGLAAIAGVLLGTPVLAGASSRLQTPLRYPSANEGISKSRPAATWMTASRISSTTAESLRRISRIIGHSAPYTTIGRSSSPTSAAMLDCSSARKLIAERR